MNSLTPNLLNRLIKIIEILPEVEHPSSFSSFVKGRLEKWFQFFLLS